MRWVKLCAGIREKTAGDAFAELEAHCALSSDPLFSRLFRVEMVLAGLARHDFAVFGNTEAFGK